MFVFFCCFFQAEDGIRDLVRSRGLGDVYKRQPSLSGDEKNKILTALKNRITSEGEIVIISQSERSQLMNRRKAEEKFFNLLAKILTPVPERKSTSPTQASKLKRIDGKRKRSAKKRLRNEKGLGEERD